MNNEQTKTPGQIAYEAHHEEFLPNDLGWNDIHSSDWMQWESIASAVISHVLQGAKWVLLDFHTLIEKGDEELRLNTWLPVRDAWVGTECGHALVRRPISLPSSVRPEGNSQLENMAFPPICAETSQENDPRPRCKRCRCYMTPSKAIPEAMVNMGESQHSVGAHVGNAPLVDVWKCPECGHSFQSDKPAEPVVEEKLSPTWDTIKQLVSMVETARGQMGALTSERDQLRKELESLQRKTDNRGILSVTEEDETFREQCWKSMYSSMFQDLDEHRKKVSSLTTENAELKEKLNRDERTDVQSAINLHRESYLKADSDLRRLAIHAQTLEDHIRKQNERSERLEAELTRLRSQFRWTPISERLPTEKDAVDGELWFRSKLDKKLWVDDWKFALRPKTPYTHWMTPISCLEAPPETEEQAMRRELKPDSIPVQDHPKQFTVKLLNEHGPDFEYWMKHNMDKTLETSRLVTFIPYPGNLQPAGVFVFEQISKQSTPMTLDLSDIPYCPSMEGWHELFSR